MPPKTLNTEGSSNSNHKDHNGLTDKQRRKLGIEGQPSGQGTMPVIRERRERTIAPPPPPPATTTTKATTTTTTPQPTTTTTTTTSTNTTTGTTTFTTTSTNTTTGTTTTTVTDTTTGTTTVTTKAPTTTTATVTDTTTGTTTTTITDTTTGTTTTTVTDNFTTDSSTTSTNATSTSTDTTSTSTTPSHTTIDMSPSTITTDPVTGTITSTYTDTTTGSVTQTVTNPTTGTTITSAYDSTTGYTTTTATNFITGEISTTTVDPFGTSVTIDTNPTTLTSTTHSPISPYSSTDYETSTISATTNLTTGTITTSYTDSSTGTTTTTEYDPSSSTITSTTHTSDGAVTSTSTHDLTSGTETTTTTDTTTGTTTTTTHTATDTTTNHDSQDYIAPHNDLARNIGIAVGVAAVVTATALIAYTYYRRRQNIIDKRELILDLESIAIGAITISAPQGGDTPVEVKEPRPYVIDYEKLEKYHAGEIILSRSVDAKTLKAKRLESVMKFERDTIVWAYEEDLTKFYSKKENLEILQENHPDGKKMDLKSYISSKVEAFKADEQFNFNTYQTIKLGKASLERGDATLAEEAVRIGFERAKLEQERKQFEREKAQYTKEVQEAEERLAESERRRDEMNQQLAAAIESAKTSKPKVLIEDEEIYDVANKADFGEEDLYAIASPTIYADPIIAKAPEGVYHFGGDAPISNEQALAIEKNLAETKAAFARLFAEQDDEVARNKGALESLRQQGEIYGTLASVKMEDDAQGKSITIPHEEGNKDNSDNDGYLDFNNNEEGYGFGDEDIVATKKTSLRGSPSLNDEDGIALTEEDLTIFAPSPFSSSYNDDQLTNSTGLGDSKRSAWLDKSGDSAFKKSADNRRAQHTTIIEETSVDELDPNHVKLEFAVPLQEGGDTMVDFEELPTATTLRRSNDNTPSPAPSGDIELVQLTNRTKAIGDRDA